MVPESSEVYAEVDRRMREAHQTMLAVLERAFCESLKISIEECMRIDNEALGRLLSEKREEPKPWRS